jgi:diadenosine tetraphosphate (Ap4A) HIT family hydrolase
MARSSCSICAEIQGRSSAPGGTIHDDGLWLVTHHPGACTDPGEVIVKLKRHAETLSDLTVAEATSLSPVLRAAVSAVERVVRPERVYVASYGEKARHLHFFLLPRTTGLPAGHVVSDVYRRGRTLLRQWGLLRNPPASARAEAAARIRDDEAWRRLST